jgi:5-formyltetrahydrofolate cyclo-ligase
MADKTEIRKKILQIRKGIPEDIRKEKNIQIARRLMELDLFKKSKKILFYYSHKGEVDTLWLIEECMDIKELYLPMIRQKNHFRAVPVKRPLTLIKGKEGVPEPIDSDPESRFDDEIDLVITPGVAFDKKGNRIGMGKGYYDRYFEKYSKAKKIALAYEEQILDSIPKDKYDKPVDVIVTEKKIYRIN